MSWSIHVEISIHMGLETDEEKSLTRMFTVSRSSLLRTINILTAIRLLGALERQSPNVKSPKQFNAANSNAPTTW